TLGDTAARSLERLLEDPDSFVRLRTLVGFSRARSLFQPEKTESFLSALRDSSSAVRREGLACLSRNRQALDDPGIVAGVADLLEDPDENVRLDAIRLTTSSNELLASEPVRRRLPDLFMDRLTSGQGILEELNTARDIQRELLPDQPPVLDNQEVAVYYSPAREVGGDYYDFFDLPEGNLGVAVGDVLGKGIPAALTMAGLQGTLMAHIRTLFDIKEIVSLVNQTVCSGGAIPNLVSLFYGVLQLESGRLTYVNAGHNPPLLVSRSGEVRKLETGGLILGVRREEQYEAGLVEMSAGDILVLYTDGITEAMDDDEEEYGMDRLVGAIRSYRDLTARQIAARVVREVERFRGGSVRTDDQTLVVLRQL
ncbi:SpoIIE family protein phosphatase, partial [Candidatus Fermentibacterales bacterium]|nr:SpoIIE family protein phosphatase [Candidatus Fermentibacterales bacterium]